MLLLWLELKVELAPSPRQGCQSMPHGNILSRAAASINSIILNLRAISTGIQIRIHQSTAAVKPSLFNQTINEAIPYQLPNTKMGWLPWSSSSSDDAPKSSDGGRIAPDRSSRERCWEGRDRFFACLDKNDILDAVRDERNARGKCGKELEEFEGACAKAWV